MDEVLTNKKVLSVDIEKIQQKEEEDEDEEEEEEEEEKKEKTVVYYVRHDQEPFDEWLEENMPSVIREDNADFVGVYHHHHHIFVDKPRTDVMGLLKTFIGLIASDRELINKQLLFDLAEEFYVTSGKWMLLPVTTGIKVDVLWTKVARAIAEARIPCNYAKVSTMDADKLINDPTHVICIYNNDFQNFDEVKSLESGIRSIGIRGKLCYKPDVYTYCGVYRGNAWGMSPIIYQSNYDIKSQKSKIDLF